VVFVAFSSGGERVVTASRDNTAKIWDAETGREVLTLKGAPEDVNTVAFSRDLKRVVTGSNDGTAKVWDAESSQPVLTLRGHLHSVNSVAFSLDGKRVVTGSADRTAKVWDAEKPREAEITILRGHSDVVLSVAFSPDGKRVVTGSGDKTVKLWDSETGQEILTLRGHADAVVFIAFSPDGKQLATTSVDGVAMIWHALDCSASREEHERQKHARYREWLLAKCGIKAMEAEPRASAAGAYVIPVLNLHLPEDMEACAANLRDVYAAIKKYEKDKGKLPNWLSDLVPEYLSKDRLLCPQDTQHRSPYYPDPNLPCSYTFEFSPAPVPPGWERWRSLSSGQTEIATCRDWKKTQVKLFGDVVPLTRCLHHGSRTLNLSVGGRIYWSDMNWEFVFKPDYRLGDLSSEPR
jgi:hypothetical protein